MKRELFRMSTANCIEDNGGKENFRYHRCRAVPTTPLRADWTGDATSEFCNMGNDRDLLADEEMACAMQHQAALLLRCILVLPF